MKYYAKSIIPLLLMALSAACGGLMPETGASTDGRGTTEITKEMSAIETQMVIPTATPGDTPIALPPVTITPIAVFSENGITWTECIAPYRDYARDEATIDFAVDCLDMDPPRWDDHDRQIAGERIEGGNGSDLLTVIGDDVFLAKHESTFGCCDYKFLKNGEVILEASAPFYTFDPNRHLWNIGGKAVWELIAEPPVIIVDGLDYNREYDLQGSFFPYAINDKLLYIALKNDRYQIIYDGKAIGHEFDEIYMKYCCSETTVMYGSGHYWFWGKWNGTYYVVGIK